MLQLVTPKGFCHCRHVFETIRKAVRAIAGSEHEGDTAISQDIGYGKSVVAMQVYIENRRVDLSVSRQRSRLLQPACEADHAPSQLFQKIFHHHGDHRFVFDDQYARGGHKQFLD